MSGNLKEYVFHTAQESYVHRVLGNPVASSWSTFTETQPWCLRVLQINSDSSSTGAELCKTQIYALPVQTDYLTGETGVTVSRILLAVSLRRCFLIGAFGAVCNIYVCSSRSGVYLTGSWFPPRRTAPPPDSVTKPAVLTGPPGETSCLCTPLFGINSGTKRTPFPLWYVCVYRLNLHSTQGGKNKKKEKAYFSLLTQCILGNDGLVFKIGNRS